MKAVVYKGPRQVVVENVEDPRIEQPTDALVRITSCALCGSDLHMYEGRAGARPGLVFGHEPLGVVEEVGPAVTSIKKGDRVFMPAHISCGFCTNCVRGYTASCLTVNPGSWGASYGYAHMGPYRGAQAEYLRVPYADANCIQLPGTPGDEREDDFAMLPDAIVTGYHATELAQVGPGATVAIFGAGTIGLLTAYCALLRGAAEVYIVDLVADRLQKAREIGAIPIDLSKGDPVEQIRELRRQMVSSLAQVDPVMMGVMCGIDAVGFEAKDLYNPTQENPTTVIDALCGLVNPTGHLGIVGVYETEDPGASTENLKHGKMTVPWATMFRKGITVGYGRTNDKRYDTLLRELVISGRAKPGFVVTHHLSFDDVVEAYQKFDRREPGYIKVVLRPTS